MKHKLKLLLIITILSSFSFTCNAGEHKSTVRVGYWEDYGISTSSDGVLSGYGYDYLNEIALINDWTLEFIPCEWSDALEMLKNKELDLFGTLQKSDEREQFYDYPDINFGSEYATLYVACDNETIFYNNPESIDGKTVGTARNNYFITLLENYCEEKNITLNYKYIDDSAALQTALEQGEIDVLLSGSIRNVPNSKVALKFDSAPFYYATYKGNQEILDGLNYALTEIKRENIYFDADLHNQHYQHTAISTKTFTSEERVFISQYPKLKIAFHTDWRPLDYYDTDTKTYKGISVDIADLISKYSGIEFEYIHAETYPQAIEMLGNGDIDILGGLIDGQLILNTFALESTTPYLNSSFVFVGKRGIVPDTTAKRTIALPQNSAGTEYRLKEAYPNFKVAEYETANACLNAVLNGEVNYAVLNSYVADNTLRGNQYNTLAVVSTMHGETPIVLGVSEKSPAELLSILNKSILSINTDTLNEIIFKHTVGIPYVFTWQEILKQNMPLGILLLFLFFVTFTLFYLWTKSVKTKELNKIAFYDNLTGNINLVKFKLQFKDILSNDPNPSWAVLSLDIDKFKSINDLLGYEQGDKLILHLSRCIANNLTKEEFFAREHADKFVILMNYTDEKTFEERFYKITQSAELMENQTSMDMRLILSAGLYIINPGDSNITAIIDRADYARRLVKDNHQSTYAVYNYEMYEQLNLEKQIESVMDYALKQNEFVVYLQPKFSVAAKELTGAEALVRWLSPERGLVPPDKFIPLFEKNGFVVDLDLYVFRKVCNELSLWRERGYKLLPISVNFSRRHISNPNFVENLLSIVKDYNLSTDYLELELTESAFIESEVDTLVSLMNHLHAVGFRLSMDDFGSGYSSLTQLKELPIDILKLDKSFFSITSDYLKEKALFKNIVNLSKDLGITTVAEGIETEEQYELLRESDCDIVQGYLFGRPIPMDAFEAKHMIIQ